MAASASSSATTETKRLIISGLSPAISEQDLASRFAPFGSVKVTDGLGLLDGNGDPRKFAFLTLETTEAKLTKCMNLLNGTKWKGSKLRIGLARPDYMDIDTEKPAEGKTKRKKRKSLPKDVDGREAQDMSITTLENVADRKGWKRTPLDHLIKPVVLRPDHPLPPTISLASSETSNLRSKDKKGDKSTQTTKSKLKEKKLLSRSRRTVIDPIRYGAVHITAASGLLGSAFEPPPQQVFAVNDDSPSNEDDERESSEDEKSSSSASPTSSARSPSPPPAKVKSKQKKASSPPPPPPPKPTSKVPVPSSPPVDVEEIQEEKKRELDILNSLLGNSETLAWEPDSDLEELALANSDKRKAEEEEPSSSESEDSSSDEDEPMHPPPETEGPGAKVVNLKDMFAPRPDDAGFSIFDNLADVGMDLEMDDTDEPQAPTRPPDFSQTSFPSTLASETTFDPSAPFFFPLPRDEHGLVDLPGRGPRPRDLSDVLKTMPGDNFWRTETEEEMRKHWDEVKGDMTREYKQRHRAAVRRKKPQGQGGGEGN